MKIAIEMGNTFAPRIGMNGVLLTFRIPDEARIRLRAISIVTSLPLHDVVVAAFETFYRRLPVALRREVEDIVRAQLRYQTKGGRGR